MTTSHWSDDENKDNNDENEGFEPIVYNHQDGQKLYNEYSVQ